MGCQSRSRHFNTFRLTCVAVTVVFFSKPPNPNQTSVQISSLASSGKSVSAVLKCRSISCLQIFHSQSAERFIPLSTLHILSFFFYECKSLMFVSDVALLSDETGGRVVLFSFLSVCNKPTIPHSAVNSGLSNFSLSGLVAWQISGSIKN